MSVAVASLAHIKGETITWGLRSSPAYDGSETVTCAIKKAVNNIKVPDESAPVVVSPTVSFVATSGDVIAHYIFTLTAVQSNGLDSENYITDAKIVYANGSVDYPQPLRIFISGKVTP